MIMFWGIHDSNDIEHNGGEGLIHSPEAQRGSI